MPTWAGTWPCTLPPAIPATCRRTKFPEALRANERRILTEQAAGEGKPPEIVAKMVEGRLRKYLNEIALVGQPFVKDPDTSIAKLLKDRGARVHRFVRLEVGEGIEKKSRILPRPWRPCIPRGDVESRPVLSGSPAPTAVKSGRIAAC